MTAEIAILNKYGVALAADSAVTISFPDRGNKVFTANKLFMLSKYFPVGVMIYGNASILGVPWELIIKEYRTRSLGVTGFPKLSDYAEDFIKYLNGNQVYFTPDLQKEAITRILEKQIAAVLNDLTPDMERLVREGTVNEESFHQSRAELFEEKLREKAEELEAENNIDGFQIDEQVFYSKYAENIEYVTGKIIRCFPEGQEISSGTIELTKRVAYLAIVKNTFHRNFDTSGVVIAGYGENQIYPSLIGYDIEGVFDDQLKYEITHDDPERRQALIIPFAQDDMIATFIDGVSPDYKQMIDGYVHQVFTDKLPDIAETLFEDFQAHANRAARQFGSGPILDAVYSLPIEQLASMAQTLVNLTAFKRQVTPDLETVGGPVDVAVITKGDGFIWMERKHYFDAVRNPHFATNYYRGDYKDANAKKHHN